MQEQILYDEQTQSKTRFISFIGEHSRYDLCLIYGDRFFGKTLVLNMLSNQFAIIGTDDLHEEGYLEEAYRLSELEASELRSFLGDLL